MAPKHSLDRPDISGTGIFVTLIFFHVKTQCFPKYKTAIYFMNLGKDIEKLFQKLPSDPEIIYCPLGENRTTFTDDW